LVFIISYSGNTEESISAFLDGIKRGCKLIALSSNGILEKLSEKYNIPFIKIPAGYQPREAIAWLLFPIGKILEAQGLFKLDIKECLTVLKKLSLKLTARSAKENPARKIALKLNSLGKIPIIYGHTYLLPVAKRWATQLNENSKLIAFSSSFPEMTHNEIVGLNNNSHRDKFVHILLRAENENKRLRKRIELTKKLVLRNNLEIYAEGKTTLAKILSLLYIGDFVSFYLAVLRKVDPVPVKIIEKLKFLLKKQS
jgi:glucose/mannose-6-phosphate isomerase